MLAAQPQITAMLNSRTSRIFSVGSIWILAATDLHAQSPRPEGAELGGVIVTARKIPEPARNAPVAVTVLSAERIHNYNVNSLEQVAAITPGLIVTRGNSGSGADFSLRGIGSNFSSIGIEQSVAVVMDGVYYGQGRVIDESFLDLERIEILKGPQALFFGKNSTAGVISITTANPGPEFEAKGRVGYETNTRSPLGEVVISGPISDTMRVRFVAAGQKMFGGYVRNRANAGTYTTIDAATGQVNVHAVPAPDDRDLPDESLAIGRLTALYKPADDFEVSLKASVQNHRLEAHQEFNDTSPEVTLSWKPRQNLMLYLAYKTGYKSGGFSNSANDVVGGAGVANLAFEPETVEGVEGGLKTALLDQRLYLAAHAYRYRFSDLQVDFFNAQNFALITTNAGSAISEGVELEGEYRPGRIDGLKIRGAVAYNRAHYGDYIGPCYAGQTRAQGCNIVGNRALQDLGGKPTADSPRWTGMLGIDHDRQLGGGLIVGLSTELRYSDNYSVSPFAQPLDRQSSYVNVDAAIRLRTPDERWKLEAIGKNLTNEFVVTYASDMPSTGTPPGGETGQLADQFALFAPARTITLQLTYLY